jgi:hypothetical protein
MRPRRARFLHSRSWQDIEMTHQPGGSDMKRKLLKAAGALAAPKLIRSISKPAGDRVLKATRHAADGVLDLLPLRRRRRASPMRIAAKGLGAAAIALPVGLWVGRQLWNRGGEGSAA